jgi:hypothetical protein
MRAPVTDVERPEKVARVTPEDVVQAGTSVNRNGDNVVVVVSMSIFT